jgi:hypothetical protein
MDYQMAGANPLCTTQSPLNAQNRGIGISEGEIIDSGAILGVVFWGESPKWG